MADALVKDAVKHGIDEEAARALVVQTMIGSGKLLEQDPHKPLSEFIDDVCSKGGTTIEAVNVLQEQKLEEIITAADARCIARANELGKK
jgi:pyrroline-5-carboxylate reductase